MDLATARQQITASFERMRALYFTPVFDEWVILAPGSQQSGILAYTGPRVEEFRKSLPDDVKPLLAQVSGLKLEPGDFEFTHSGDGTRHDVLLKLGVNSYLVCNNTAKSMAEIRADARWLKAQAAFVDLSEKFRVDPLVV
ncbi:MAG: hypothetical protein DUW69_001155 [Verrucomicrobia bacterium]|jgi:hypothetical protein|nr:MAG: hypothetical protein DUW69_001155 [Verrucomicrobiota bacterium]